MSRRTDFFNQQQMNFKQNLGGWEHEMDDLSDNNNLLKILEKKITLPAIQSTSHKTKKFKMKLETLPAVIEESSKNSIDRNLINAETNFGVQASPLKQKQKKQQMKVEPTIKSKLIKCHTQKNKLSHLQSAQEENLSQFKVIADSKVKKQKSHNQHTFNLSQFQFGDLSKNNNEHSKIVKRVSSNLIIKHKKIPSVQLFPINHRNVDFDKSPSTSNIKNVAIDKKNIRWDRFSISQQKFKLKFEESSNKIHKQKQKEKANIIDKGLTNMLWMEKMLHRSKLDTHEFVKNRKIVKTEVNDYFMDDHLQSCQSQGQHTQFY